MYSKTQKKIGKINAKKTSPNHIIDKQIKNKTKEKTLKGARVKAISFSGIRLRMIDAFPTEMVEVRKHL